MSVAVVLLRLSDGGLEFFGDWIDVVLRFFALQSKDFCSGLHYKSSCFIQ